MSILLNATTKLETCECCVCHMTFAMNSEFKQKRLDDHKLFWCPAGHEQFFSGKSEKERLKEQLAETERVSKYREQRIREELAEKARITRRLNATRGVVTRHKRKIGSGTCPCCSKKFKALAKHMKVEHPHWDPVKEADVKAGGTA